ncbi:hypothetical protein C5B89_19360 [Haloferax sp. Atlit-47N]|nr:hypothetical protein C5B89_19360 [Haloferax sp. Atlit-47N]
MWVCFTRFPKDFEYVFFNITQQVIQLSPILWDLPRWFDRRFFKKQPHNRNHFVCFYRISPLWCVDRVSFYI